MLQQSKYTVLAVDDCPENLDLIRNTLEPHYHVKVALDGKLALQVAETWQPDLILLDIMLDDMDGYEVCRRLKSSDSARNIPIIFLTSKTSESDEVLGFHNGCNDYITKPFSPSIVLSRVSTQIQLKAKTDLLEKLASLDGLTEIPNRRAFDIALARMFNQSQRNTLPLSLLIIDIDFFKQYNDFYGHPKGDECIQRVAQALTQNTQRSGDLVARLGGEEFAILLPDTDNLGAMMRAEHYRELVENLRIPHAASVGNAYITISIGVATIIAKRCTSSAELVESADNALYRAKTEGRNQICSHNLVSD